MGMNFKIFKVDNQSVYDFVYKEIKEDEINYCIGQASINEVMNTIDFNYNLLSSLEYKIVKLLQANLSISEISRILDLSESYIKLNINTLYKRILNN